jgi:hypothetical protein
MMMHMLMAKLNDDGGVVQSVLRVQAQREIIEAFLSHGVSPDLKDGSGKCVWDGVRSGWIRDMLRASADSDA